MNHKDTENTEVAQRRAVYRLLGQSLPSLACLAKSLSARGKVFQTDAGVRNVMSALVPKVTRELTRMRRTLRETFGLDKLRHGQSEVIRSVLEGNNTLAIMPTGAGKSLCSQLRSLHLHGTTVVSHCKS